VNDDLLVTAGIPLLGAALALLTLFFGIRASRRQRLVDNLPTSKTTGVFIGLVELKGTAEAEQPLVSYLTGSRCVHYRWQIEERWSKLVTETYRDSKGNTRTRTRTKSGWTTVAQGGETIPFYLRDDCGVIRIQPDGAKIEPPLLLSETCTPGNPLYYDKGPAGAVMHSDHRRRFVEHTLPLHAPLYVVGRARERDDIVAAEIAAAADTPLFLISTRTEQQVSRGFRAGFWLLGFCGLVLTLAGIFVRGAMLNRTPADDLPLFLALGTCYACAWLLGWAWMAYNSLVELRQRVGQAWANVDVQLKRRHDLIPNLVGIVTGLRDHERTVQTAVAALRSQLAATPPGQPGPDPAGIVPSLRAVAEAYPDLKANTSFLNLQRQLAETEQRLALARAYFNDIATFYNTRLEIIPDRFIAALATMQPQSLLAATDFERAPVAVQLAE